MKKNKQKLETFKGERHIIHFTSGIKRTVEDVICVWENEMTHLLTAKGVEWKINKNNVLAVEVIRNPISIP